MLIWYNKSLGKACPERSQMLHGHSKKAQSIYSVSYVKSISLKELARQIADRVLTVIRLCTNKNVI